MTRLKVLIALAVAVAPIPGAGVLNAQQLDTAAVRVLLEQRLGRSVSQGEILEGIRQSGLSREEARSRLQQLGYDPSVADYYYDQLEAGAGAEVGGGDSEFLQALERLGLARAGEAAGPVRDSAAQAGAAADTGRLTAANADTAAADSAAAAAEPDALPYFGRKLFARSTTEFEPVSGPVPPDYRLGPGDEVVLVLTGDVELVRIVTVSASGALVIPDVGQVFVNGLTLGQLEDLLYDRLGRVYSGVRRGPEATTRFHVSLGTLRRIQVYVVGAVERPGGYPVSSVATVFEALYQAGGPAVDGSFRNIQVRRGGRVVQEIDLYDYLLYGDSRSDIRLEHGDMIFVPLAQRRVTVKGAVRRPAIYEVRQQEGLRDLLEYGGGLQPDAFLRQVQIDRILPPDARRPGLDRVLIDVDVQQVLDDEGDFIPVNAGDVVEVFAVSEVRRHRVTVTGEVHRPGTYEWQEGTTLWDLIERAQGLDEEAYTPRGHIYRLNEDDGTRRLIRTPLLADSAGEPAQDVLLTDRDSIVIYSREELRNPAVVAINGFVKKPGPYPLAEGMTLQDLILAAGGFVEGANVLDADVARLPEGVARVDTTAYVVRVSLDGTFAPADAPAADTVAQSAGGALAQFGYENARRPEPGEVPLWRPNAEEFELRHGDRVFIRRAPGYQPTRMVMVTGQVMMPGAYALETRQDRLLDVLARTGGLTGEAYPQGLQTVRAGKVVPVDLWRARQDPDGGHNLVLEAGDSIHVPSYDPTVVVTGAVNFESRVLYQPDRGLDYYISQSGGYTDNADQDGVTITYQNGEREDVDKVLGLFASKPDPAPGSTIFVPAKPGQAQGLNVDRLLSRMTTVVGVLVALIAATNN